jgi:hypothetical protein
MKLPRKHTRENTYTATIGNLTFTATGKTRREAEKRMRSTFAKAGRSTIIRNPSTDPMDQCYIDYLNMERV